MHFDHSDDAKQACKFDQARFDLTPKSKQGKPHTLIIHLDRGKKTAAESSSTPSAASSAAADAYAAAHGDNDAAATPTR